MTARVLAAALAIVVTAAPVSMTMCEAACAERSADAMHGGRGEHHSCHEAASPNEVQISGSPHGCGHSDGDDQIGTEHQTKLVPPSTAAVMDATIVPVVSTSSSRITTHYITHSPPGPLVLSTQLRI